MLTSLDVDENGQRKLSIEVIVTEPTVEEPSWCC